MRKTLIGIVTVAFLTLLVANAYAQCIPAPPCCGCLPCGFTPGFWKHNIEVRLGLTDGAYSAFEGGPLDGVKLTDAMMDGFLAAINAELEPDVSFGQLLAYLKGPGWSTDRTNTANWFNYVAGYGYFS